MTLDEILKDYIPSKAEGKITAARQGKTLGFTVRQYDQESGVLAPEFVAVDKSVIQGMIADSQALIDSLKAVLADMKAL